MAKSKKVPTPAPELAIEVVVWKDHASTHNEPVDFTVIQQVSIGAVFFEDDEQIQLLQCCRVDTNPFVETQVDSAQILKPNIVSRRKVGIIAWPPEEDGKT
jgi:hypothetical protein